MSIFVLSNEAQAYRRRGFAQLSHLPWIDAKGRPVRLGRFFFFVLTPPESAFPLGIQAFKGLSWLQTSIVRSGLPSSLGAVFGPSGRGCSQRYPHPGYAQNYAVWLAVEGSRPVDRNGDTSRKMEARRVRRCRCLAFAGSRPGIASGAVVRRGDFPASSGSSSCPQGFT